MQFCNKCGTILVQKVKRFVCPKCGFVGDSSIKLTASENIAPEAIIGVMKEKDSNVWPVVNANCPKCGHDEAETWSTQMRAGDEGETVFFRCKKCKMTWRERE
jgi:DNA-directed RNA polymerase subunit M